MSQAVLIIGILSAKLNCRMSLVCEYVNFLVRMFSVNENTHYKQNWKFYFHFWKKKDGIYFPCFLCSFDHWQLMENATNDQPEWLNNIPMNQTSLATRQTQDRNKTAHLQLFSWVISHRVIYSCGWRSYEKYSNPIGGSRVGSERNWVMWVVGFVDNMIFWGSRANSKFNLMGGGGKKKVSSNTLLPFLLFFGNSPRGTCWRG